MKEKTVLFCVLNWGLGHATRSLAMIQELEKNNCTMVIASDGLALDLLIKELPGRKYYRLPSYNIRYTISPIVGTLLSLPAMAWAVWLEKRIVSKIVTQNKIDVIISDNRFGAFSRSCESQLIIHQLNPFFYIRNQLISTVSKYLFACALNRFSTLLIPDDEKYDLCGEMTANEFVRLPKRYIGILSRFSVSDRQPSPLSGSILVILSGPEPDRTRLEQFIFSELMQSESPATIILGRKVADNEVFDGLFTVKGVVGSAELLSEIHRAGLIISRSGYSSVMDYVSLNRHALLIPTPGMPEQEYLAERMSKREGFSSISQLSGELCQFIKMRR